MNGVTDQYHDARYYGPVVQAERAALIAAWRALDEQTLRDVLVARWLADAVQEGDLEGAETGAEQEEETA